MKTLKKGISAAPNKRVAALATALWAVSRQAESAANTNWPQVRTPDGFVLRRTGGYNVEFAEV